MCYLNRTYHVLLTKNNTRIVKHATLSENVPNLDD